MSETKTAWAAQPRMNATTTPGSIKAAQVAWSRTSVVACWVADAVGTNGEESAAMVEP